jgi:hypothetical protein
MKQRALAEFECAFLRTVDICTGQVGRQQIGRELQTMEITLDTLGKHLDRARLGETGGTFNQQVTIAQQRNQHAVDQVCLADNKRARMSL